VRVKHSCYRWEVVRLAKVGHSFHPSKRGSRRLLLAKVNRENTKTQNLATTPEGRPRREQMATWQATAFYAKRTTASIIGWAHL
jgi:hypothetical protein